VGGQASSPELESAVIKHGASLRFRLAWYWSAEHYPQVRAAGQILALRPRWCAAQHFPLRALRISRATGAAVFLCKAAALKRIPSERCAKCQAQH